MQRDVSTSNSDFGILADRLKHGLGGRRVPTIVHTLIIAEKPQKVYKALTEQDGLRGWWTRFSMAEPTVGYVNQFGFGGSFKFLMRIDDLIEDELVQWSCLEGHEEWEGTRIEFRLDPLSESKTTRLAFSHAGWAREDGVFPQCNYDWAQYLRSLKLYVEQGKGTPS